MRLQKRQTRASEGVTALISLEDMKLHLLEYNSDRDSVITALVASCTSDLQNELGFYIDTTGIITQYYDDFASRMYIFHRFIKSDTADLSIEYLNDAGTWTVIATSVYRIDPSSNPASVILKSDQEWPTPIDEPSCIRIKFKVDTTHPAMNSFKQVIKEMVAEAYENPEGSWKSSIMESATRRVVSLYRMRT